MDQSKKRNERRQLQKKIELFFAAEMESCGEMDVDNDEQTFEPAGSEITSKPDSSNLNYSSSSSSSSGGSLYFRNVTFFCVVMLLFGIVMLLLSRNATSPLFDAS